MDKLLAEKIRGCPNLPSLPAVAVQVLELAQKVDAEIAEIARVISKDPALSSKILKTVNSSFYGRSKNVSTISQALVILGLQSVRTLVLGFSLVSGLSKKKAKAFPHIDFWKRSLFSATAAKMIAAKISFPDTEEAFLAALLMDIGMLALDLVLPEQYADVYAKAANHEGLGVAEREVLETDHAEVAGLLCEHWKLPAVLQSPVAHHHLPGLVDDPQQRQLTQLIHIAGQCANIFIDEQTPVTIAQMQGQLETLYGIADADALLSEIGKKTKELASLFEINIGPTQDFEAILKKASETLVKITLQSQTKSAAPAPAELASREAVERFLTEQFNVAREKRTNLSLLALGIDDLAELEAKRGKPAAEAAAAFAARLIAAAARNGCLAGRGEASGFWLAMPGGDRAAATALGETVRRAMGARPIPVPGGPLPITLSVGVASFQPGSPFRNSDHLTKAATLALQNAQRGGRNCVKIFSLPTPPAAAA